MTIEASATAAAEPEQVWSVLQDIRHWPEWTKSVISVEPLDDAPLRVGSRARVKQPGMPAMIWEVTELTAPSEFTWQSKSAGVRVLGRHLLAPLPGGGTKITLTIDQRGLLAPLVKALTGARTKRYVTMEANGLKAAGESVG
ncbi:MAG: SRPBCC family protein [Jatrophihabitans sp.]